jgi:hypothetical protein
VSVDGVQIEGRCSECDQVTDTLPCPFCAPRLDERVAAEIRRQDRVSTITTDRDGVRLALACLQDEVAESVEAFQVEKRPQEGRTWALTEGEVVQVAAVALRLLRELA